MSAPPPPRITMFAPATSASWMPATPAFRSVADSNPWAAGRLWAILPPETVSTRLSAASSPVNVIGSPAAFTVTFAAAVAGRASAAEAASAPTIANGLRRAAFMTGSLGRWMLPTWERSPGERYSVSFVTLSTCDPRAPCRHPRRPPRPALPRRLGAHGCPRGRGGPRPGDLRARPAQAARDRARGGRAPVPARGAAQHLGGHDPLARSAAHRAARPRDG